MAVIDGSNVRDVLAGTAQADVMSGFEGSDTLAGGPGGDRLYGHGPWDADPGAATIQAIRVASGLSGPLYGASPPGEPDRLFLVEQHTGRIQILDLTTNTIQGTFLKIPDDQYARGGEQGMLGLVFHPDYAANGRFFVNLTNAAGDTEIREYRRASADQADPASMRMVLTFDQPYDNHNGGWMGFGPDGLLYVASGDGGSFGDPLGHAQNINSLLGKVLRLDVNGDAFPGDANRNYAIPAGNPFANSAGADEIFAYGLRNPWRMSFDPATGELYIADVGQSQREELNVLAAGAGAGANFGWDLREGTVPHEGPAPPGAIEPVLDYTHGSGPYQGRSTTGGYVYRGEGGAQGLYVFGDFVSGNLWTVRVTGGVAQDFLNRNAQLAVDAGDIDQIASFAVDGRGRLYLIGLDGDVHRLVPGVAAGDAGDLLSGGDGDDTLDGGIGGDTLAGDADNDAIRGLADADLVDGGAGDDIVNGNQGTDTVSGGEGADTVMGGQGADVVSGGGGSDPHVNGNIGEDLVSGGAGDDTVHGGQGSDTLWGDDGDDRLSGDLGADVLNGGAGADRFVAVRGGGTDWVADFNAAAGDRIQLPSGAAYTVREVNGQAVVDIGQGDGIGLVGVASGGFSSAWVIVG